MGSLGLNTREHLLAPFLQTFTRGSAVQFFRPASSGNGREGAQRRDRRLEIVAAEAFGAAVWFFAIAAAMFAPEELKPNFHTYGEK